MAKCADEKVFYQKLNALKASSKGKESKITLFIANEFYHNAKIWLGQHKGSFEPMSKILQLLNINSGLCIKEKFKIKNGRIVIPKRKLFKTLADAHSAIAHRGRDKTEHYVCECYSGINQEVTELFVSLCTLTSISSQYDKLYEETCY